MPTYQPIIPSRVKKDFEQAEGNLELGGVLLTEDHRNPFPSDPTGNKCKMPFDDMELMVRIGAGCTGSLKELFKRYKVELVSFARRLGCTPEDAEDVLQDVSLKVWKAASSCKRNPKGWLFAIVGNTVNDYRKGGRLAMEAAGNTSDEMEPVGIEGDFADEVILRQVMRTALARLSRLERISFELSYVDGFTEVEVAEIIPDDIFKAPSMPLKVKRKVVENAKMRARRKLAEDLAVNLRPC